MILTARGADGKQSKAKTNQLQQKLHGPFANIRRKPMPLTALLAFN